MPSSPRSPGPIERRQAEPPANKCHDLFGPSDPLHPSGDSASTKRVKFCLHELQRRAALEMRALWLERSQSAAKSGDIAAFGCLVELHEQRVFRAVPSILGNDACAEDAVQDAFLRAFRPFASFDNLMDPWAWLYKLQAHGE